MGIIQTILRIQEAGTRKFYTTVQDNHIEDPSYGTAGIAKDKDYFRVRLSEMFLKDKTNYINGFIPMAVALNVFSYGGSQCTVPVLVGNQVLSTIDKYVKNETVEFRNVPIIGPVPHTGDDFSLFIGLYRVSVENLSKSLFGVIEKLVGAFNLANLSSYLGIAKHIGDGLVDLIGLKEVEMRLGIMDTFGSGANTLRDRYLLCVNAPEHEVNSDRLWVKNGRLYEGDSIESNTVYNSHDYCLVRIERLETRPDITSLPFHQLFEESKAKIWDGNPPEAERLFLTLMRQLTNSPDLTVEDRGTLMETYLANYQQEKENYAGITSRIDGRGEAVVRGTGGRDGKSRTLSATASIQRVADMAEGIARQSERSEDLMSVHRRLNQLAHNLKEIPHLAVRDTPTDLDDAMLSEQFRSIKASQKIALARPEALAEALSLASYQNL
jgi:hypothetical protein